MVAADCAIFRRARNIAREISSLSMASCGRASPIPTQDLAKIPAAGNFAPSADATSRTRRACAGRLLTAMEARLSSDHVPERAIFCMVGDEMRLIDFDIFLSASDELAEQFRAAGMTGQTLDEHVAAHLPKRLAEKLGVSGGTRH